MKTLAFALALLALSAGVAYAQDNVIREADKTVFKAKTVVDFSDVTIEGELTKPEGSYIASRKNTNFNTLIRLRENFIPEMVRSVDNL